MCRIPASYKDHKGGTCGVCVGNGVGLSKATGVGYGCAGGCAWTGQIGGV